MFSTTARPACAGCAVVLSGCLATEIDPWEQLSPDGPCIQVELADGLNDGEELLVLFECLDHHGHLESLRPARDVLVAGGGEAPLVEALNAGSATTALAVPTTLPDPSVQGLLLEVLSGAPGDAVGAAAPAPAGPWRGTGPAVATQLASLEQQPRAVASLAAMLAHPSVEQTLIGAHLAASGPDGAQVAGLVHHIAAAGVQGDPDGERTAAWLDTWVVDPLGALPRSFFPLQLLTEPPAWRAAVVDEVAAHDDLGAVPMSVAWLAHVDPDGQPLIPGQTSALRRILQLMENGTEPVVCTVGIEPLAIDLSFDDLTVRLLRIVAAMEPDSLGTASSVWSTLTDNAVADVALDAAVASGACPAFDEAAQEGLDALDLLTAPQTAPLLQLVAPIVTHTEEHQGLVHLASVFGAIGAPEAIDDVDALIAAVGPTPGAAEAARALQGLARQPPEGEPALRHLLDGLAFALTGDATTTGPPAVVAYPWVRLVAADPDLRRSFGGVAGIWADPGSHTTDLRAWLPEPESIQDGAAAVRPWLEADVIEPLLEAATTPGLVAALLADDGPLPAVEHALRSGTVDDALSWFESVLP